jgi:hypothetical protein
MTAFLAVAAIGGGAYAVIWPAKAQAKVEAAYQHKLQDRLNRRSDAYFEELRSIEAYPPKAGLLRRRVVGGFFLALGLAYFLFNVFA